MIQGKDVNLLSAKKYLCIVGTKVPLRNDRGSPGAKLTGYSV